MSCSICLEDYNSHTCRPVILNPCGHGTCETCLATWNRSNQSTGRTCPECRAHITSSTQNRTLIQLLENQENDPPQPTDNESIFNLANNSKRPVKRLNEVLHDRCGYNFTVIDNSGSMEHEDGKQFYLDKNGIITKYQYTSRWLEASNKVLQIAHYNISRGMNTCYYLLNPRKNGKWQENIDYVEIDPTQKGCQDKLEILRQHILSSDNIRGSTPLDLITIKFAKFLQEKADVLDNQTVCYNLVTDGQPNNKTAFETQLKRLATHYSVFIVVNLCTDADEDIDYYNQLDKKIGSELSGLDVIDDFEAEQLEVVGQNKYFVYSFMIHTARMAGCYSVVGDMMDEEGLPLAYVHKSLKELLAIDITLNMDNKSEYLLKIEEANNRADKVYNYLTKKMEPPINMTRLRRHLIWAKGVTGYINKCIIS